MSKNVENQFFKFLILFLKNILYNYWYVISKLEKLILNMSWSRKYRVAFCKCWRFVLFLNECMQVLDFCCCLTEAEKQKQKQKQKQKRKETKIEKRWRRFIATMITSCTFWVLNLTFFLEKNQAVQKLSKCSLDQH